MLSTFECCEETNLLCCLGFTQLGQQWPGLEESSLHIGKSRPSPPRDLLLPEPTAAPTVRHPFLHSLPPKAVFPVQCSFISTYVCSLPNISKNKQKGERCFSSPTCWKQKPSENSRRALACVNNFIFFYSEQVRIGGCVGTSGRS